MLSQIELERFEFLRKMSLKMGAVEAKMWYSEEAVGVKVQATAKNAGIQFTFQFEKTLGLSLYSL